MHTNFDVLTDLIETIKDITKSKCVDLRYIDAHWFVRITHWTDMIIVKNSKSKNPVHSAVQALLEIEKVKITEHISNMSKEEITQKLNELLVLWEKGELTDQIAMIMLSHFVQKKGE